MNTELGEGKAKVAFIGGIGGGKTAALALLAGLGTMNVVGKHSEGLKAELRKFRPGGVRSPKFGEKSGSVTFAEAMENGLPGRILWALTSLGRRPLHGRILEKARIPGEERDSSEDYNNALQVLKAQGLVSYDGMGVKLVLMNAPVKVTCNYAGCTETGPEGENPEAAKAAAIGDGFSIVGTQAFCPEHTTFVNATPAEGLTRRQRRNLEKAQRRAKRACGSVSSISFQERQP